MKNEEERNEEQCQESINRARELEMALMILLTVNIKKTLENDSKSARANALNIIRKSIKKETKSFLNDEKELVLNDLTKVGDNAYENLDSRSNKKINPEQFTKKKARESSDYFKKFMKTKGTNFVYDKNMDVYRYFNVFIERNVKDVVDGKVTIDEAVSKAIDELSRNGVKVIDYASGTTRSIEAFVRQQMLYASKESVQELREANAEEDGITIWEFDAHANARPSHQVWQGKRYDTTGKDYPTLEELTHGEEKDYGCKHRAYPVYSKDDPYMFSKDQLKNMNTKPFKFKDKTYDGYNATQKMRYMERRIREYKKRIKLKEEMGIDTTNDKFLLKKHNKEYSQFCKAFGTYRRSNRLKIAN